MMQKKFNRLYELYSAIDEDEYDQLKRYELAEQLHIEKYGHYAGYKPSGG